MQSYGGDEAIDTFVEALLGSFMHRTKRDRCTPVNRPAVPDLSCRKWLSHYLTPIFTYHQIHVLRS